jgi:hypothetical protein
MPRSPGVSQGAAGLGWCSPQSSVPRQTVGHHARAAMYEMGLTAACEGRRGEVPRAVPRHPPHRSLSVPFSYTHRPGRSGSHGPAGSWVDFPIPQNSFVWVLQKIGSRAPTHGDGAGGPPGPGEAPVGTRRPCSAALGAGRASRAAYPTPPDRPTLHRAPRAPALHLPRRLPYTYPAPRSRVAYPAPPKAPTLRLPTDLPYTALPGRPPCTPQPTYPIPLLFPLL